MMIFVRLQNVLTNYIVTVKKKNRKIMVKRAIGIYSVHSRVSVLQYNYESLDVPFDLLL